MHKRGILFGCLAISGGFLGVAGWYRVWAQKSRYWSRTTGKVIWAQVESEMSEDGKVFFPKILYRYKVNGQRYDGDRIYFGDVNRSEDSIEAEIILEKRRPDDEVTVFYDPSNPRRAVLERGTGPSVNRYMRWGLAFAAFGIAAIFIDFE